MLIYEQCDNTNIVLTFNKFGNIIKSVHELFYLHKILII
jgi:hypothetical protein